MVNVSVYVTGCYCHAFAFTDDSGSYSLSGICVEGDTLRFESEGYRSLLMDPKRNAMRVLIANGAMEPNIKSTAAPSSKAVMSQAKALG